MLDSETEIRSFFYLVLECIPSVVADQLRSRIIRDNPTGKGLDVNMLRPSRLERNAPDFRDPTFAEPQDDIVYLYTLPRSPRSLSTPPFRHTLVSQDRELNIVPDHSSPGKEDRQKSQFRHEQTDVDIARPKKTASSHCTTVPLAIRNQKVLLGCARDSAAQVYGFFDAAGRFRRREVVERNTRTPDICPYTTFIHIPHDQVTYRRAFQYMTHRRVRDEVRRRLIATLGTHSRYGEI